MKTKRNPLRKTVRRFVSVGEQRWLRRIRKDERDHKNELDPTTRVKRPKKPEESSFVKFMNQLETRGPNTAFNQYDAWTRRIRERMQQKKMWPKGKAKMSIKIIAQYLQELQREFWNAIPLTIKKAALRFNCVHYPHSIWSILDELNIKRVINLDEKYEISHVLWNSLKTFKKIHDKIRVKGLRSGTFIMATWGMRRSPTRIYLSTTSTRPGLRKWLWGHHDWHIMEVRHERMRWPTLVMPHRIFKINVNVDQQKSGKAFMKKGERMGF